MCLVFNSGKAHQTLHPEPEKKKPGKKRFLLWKPSFFRFHVKLWGVYISENVSFQGLLDVDSLSVENIEILLESQ